MRRAFMWTDTRRRWPEANERLTPSVSSPVVFATAPPICPHLFLVGLDDGAEVGVRMGIKHLAVLVVARLEHGKVGAELLAELECESGVLPMRVRVRVRVG